MVKGHSEMFSGFAATSLWEMRALQNSTISADA